MTENSPVTVFTAGREHHELRGGPRRIQPRLVAQFRLSGDDNNNQLRERRINIKPAQKEVTTATTEALTSKKELEARKDIAQSQGYNTISARF